MHEGKTGHGSEAWGGARAYTGRLPHVLEEALGWDEELEQAAEPVPAVAGLQQAEDLAQHRRGRGFEGRVEGTEGALHRRVQGLRVLREENVAGGESGPGAGCRHPSEPVPPSHATSTCSAAELEAQTLPVLGAGESGHRAHRAPRSWGHKHGGSRSWSSLGLAVV